MLQIATKMSRVNEVNGEKLQDSPIKDPGYSNVVEYRKIVTSEALAAVGCAC